MIDWTQPIETTETPPRPVRVLFDKDGKRVAFDLYGYGMVAITDEAQDCLVLGGNIIPLRNVAPPKPEPPEFHDSLEWDELVAERDKWKSACEHNIKTLDVVQAERDKLRTEVERMRCGTRDARDLIEERDAEIGQMRPVVDAAVAWAHWNDDLNRTANVAAHNDLVKAVRAYQSTPKKTAEEAVANVAKMMGPVKSCNNCRHDKKGGICAIEGPFSFDQDEDCQDWEVKQ